MDRPSEVGALVVSGRLERNQENSHLCELSTENQLEPCVVFRLCLDGEP